MMRFPRCAACKLLLPPENNTYGADYSEPLCWSCHRARFPPAPPSREVEEMELWLEGKKRVRESFSAMAKVITAMPELAPAVERVQADLLRLYAKMRSTAAKKARRRG